MVDDRKCWIRTESRSRPRHINNSQLPRGEAITGRPLEVRAEQGRGREFIFYPYGGIWTTTCESVMDIAGVGKSRQKGGGGGGISNKYFTSVVRIMGTFNPNPSQAPPHLTPPPRPPCPYDALWRVRHFRENTSKSFARCGRRKR